MNIDKIKELTRSGEAYNDMDPDVDECRKFAIGECRRYNFLINSQNKYEPTILENILGNVGSNVFIESDFLCEFGFNISFGDNVYVNHDMIILDCHEVKIGSNVWIGPRVGLYGANHAEDPVERANFSVTGKPITIEDNVWLGAGVHVLQGVTIGENCVIGAGSVVTKDVPANTVSAGNPCRVIRPIKKNQ